MAGKQTKLRCLLVWHDTLLEDRLFAPGQKVSVGAAPGATFVLQGQGLTRRRRKLLLVGRGRATLLLRPGMHGSVFLTGREQDIGQMLATEGLNGGANGSLQVDLAEGDGGVLVFGQVGLGFWVVPVAENAPRAALSQVLGADRFTGKLFGLALAVMVLFSFVSRLFAGTRPEMTIEQLPDRLASFIVQDRRALVEFKKDMRKIEQRARRRRQEAARRRRRTRPSRKEVTGNGQERALSAEERKLRAKVARKGLVGALGKARRTGPLKDVLGDGGLGMDLNEAVRRLERGTARARLLTSVGQGGLATSDALLARPTSGEALGEGLSRQISDRTGSAGRRAGRGSRLGGRREMAVTVAMPSSGAQVTGGELSRREIFQVVSANKGAIRYCYESQLMRFPTLRGRVTVDFIIDTSGRVGRIKVPENTLSQARAARAVASCLMRFIKRWRFPRPRGGKVRVIYPFTFGRK